MYVSGRLTLKKISCTELRNADWFGKSDPYIIASADNRAIAETKHFANELNPVFPDKFSIELHGHFTNIYLDVWDEETLLPDKHLGRYTIVCEHILEHKTLKIKDGELTEKDGKSKAGKLGHINAIIKFKTHEEIGTDYEVPNTSFKAHPGCRVTLFSDAHVGEEALAVIPHVIVDPGSVSIEVSEEQHSKEDKKKSRT